VKLNLCNYQVHYGQRLLKALCIYKSIGLQVYWEGCLISWKIKIYQIIHSAAKIRLKKIKRRQAIVIADCSSLSYSSMITTVEKSNLSYLIVAIGVPNNNVIIRKFKI
jgi:hypothetical protein